MATLDGATVDDAARAAAVAAARRAVEVSDRRRGRAGRRGAWTRRRRGRAGRRGAWTRRRRGRAGPRRWRRNAAVRPRLLLRALDGGLDLGLGHVRADPLVALLGSLRGDVDGAGLRQLRRGALLAEAHHELRGGVRARPHRDHAEHHEKRGGQTDRHEHAAVELQPAPAREAGYVVIRRGHHREIPRRGPTRQRSRRAGSAGRRPRSHRASR